MQLSNGVDLLTEIIRALDSESVRIGKLDLHQPSLDDVFLAKTGRRLEGAGEEEATGEQEAVAVAEGRPEPVAA